MANNRMEINLWNTQRINYFAAVELAETTHINPRYLNDILWGERRKLEKNTYIVADTCGAPHPIPSAHLTSGSCGGH